MYESSPITAVKGIGEKSAVHFHHAGIDTIYDLITYYPRTYDVCEDPVPAGGLTAFDDGRLVAVEGKIERALSVRYLKSIRIATGKILSGGVYLDVVWYNMPYIRGQIQPGAVYVFRGYLKAKGRGICLQQPKVYDLFEYEQLKKTYQPVYPLVRGLTENALRRALKETFYGADALDLSEEYLPQEMLGRYDLPSRKDAVRWIHFPEEEQKLLCARRRLVFEEFFFFILMLRRMRDSREQKKSACSLPPSGQTRQILDALPYTLTGAQIRCFEEVSRDMASDHVMARLIQGDVGCGKTIIAFLALVQCAANGMQGALMVPTEVLARQHYEAFQKLVSQAQIDCEAVLLTGSLKASEKKAAYKKIEDGSARVIIGTHALITEKVSYSRLALVITDEQHRFGVSQREALEKKGLLPHTIVMSATPIPRTLAVILYGDLDVSVIDEMPASRLRVKNTVVDASWRPKAVRFIASQVREGHQSYVICPMVEESEEIEAENVTDYAQTLRKSFSDMGQEITVGCLHGRMKSQEKQSVMEQFSSGQIDVLISTTVVEVGVNVPNATVMMVENAERFGLAQLHQLRGRVGRGDAQSYCIFMYKAQSDEIRSRLEILETTNDGFEIAKKDLELRGPGELFGVRQSGALAFRLADIYADAPILQLAGEAAGDFLKKDKDLTSPEGRRIAHQMKVLETSGGNHDVL